MDKEAANGGYYSFALLKKLFKLRQSYIIVINDGKIVFRGQAKQFFENNDDDDFVIKLVEQAIKNGIAEDHLFHSGNWQVVHVKELDNR